MDLTWGSLTFGTIFCIIVTAYLTHFFAKIHSKNERKIARYNNEVEKFKNSFKDACINLKCDNHTVAHILQQTFNTQKTVYIQFRDNISKKEKVKFDKIWLKYEDYYNNYSKGSVFLSFASAKTNYEIEHRNYVLNIIQELLSFAKEH